MTSLTVGRVLRGVPGPDAHVYAGLSSDLPRAQPGAANRFTAIYHQVLRRQGAPEAMALRYLASYGLPTFDSARRTEHGVAPQIFTRGDARRPALAFFPGYPALTNPAPANLGRALSGEFDLHGLTHPVPV